MKTDKRGRLEKVFEYLRSTGSIHTKKDFASALGYNYTNITSALKGNDAYLTDGLFEKISIVFPSISADWLLAGRGEMLKLGVSGGGKSDGPTPLDTQQMLEWLKDKDNIIKKKDEEIKDLREQVDHYRSELERLRIAIINSDDDSLKKEVAV